MGRLFGRRKASGDGVEHPAVAGMRLAGERDARGFRMGVVLPAHAGEATFGVRLSDASALSAEGVARWRAEVHTEASVVATCATQRVAGHDSTAVLWATVAATGKAERKDTSELLTRLAVFAPKVYESADMAGMDAKPVTRDELAECISAELVGEDATAVFPPRAATISEGRALVAVGERVTATFEIGDSRGGDEGTYGAVVALATQLSEEYDGELSVRLADWARPAERTGARDRRVGLVSLTAHDTDVVEDAMRVILLNLTAKQRLAVRRVWNRQAMAAGASLGAGVLGWQRLEVAA